MLCIGLGLLLVACAARAEIGSCPTPKVQANFDLEKFSGTWYEIESTPHVQKMAKKCSTYVLEFKREGKARCLHKFAGAISGKVKREYSEITTPKKSEPAKLLVSPLKGTILGKKQDVWVLDTDYTTYAVTFSCKKMILTNQQEVVILSRARSLDDKKKMEIYDMIGSRQLNQKNLVEISHDECDKVDKDE